MLAKLITLLNRSCILVASLVLLLMMLLACANMLLRFVGLPITGTFEMMGFGGALIAALALGGTQEKRGHIEVNLIEHRLPRRVNLFLRLLSLLLAGGLFSLMAWRLFDLAGILMATGEVSETLHLAYYPVVIVVAAGVLLLLLTMIGQLVALLKNGGDGS